MRDILERVGAVTKHKWAQDFFGLSKSSVSTLLATPRHEDEPSNKRPRSTVRRVAPILVRLQNIRNRGSGPTSQLQRNEDRGRRNSVIDEAVSFASFNDVISVYLVSGMHVPDLFGFHSWLGRGSSYFADVVLTVLKSVEFCSVLHALNGIDQKKKKKKKWLFVESKLFSPARREIEGKFHPGFVFVHIFFSFFILLPHMSCKWMGFFNNQLKIKGRMRIMRRTVFFLFIRNSIVSVYLLLFFFQVTSRG